MVGINLHDVPKDGTPADFYHGLGTVFRLLPEPRPHAAAKNDNAYLLIDIPRFRSFCIWLDHNCLPIRGRHLCRACTGQGINTALGRTWRSLHHLRRWGNSPPQEISNDDNESTGAHSDG